MDIEVGKSYKTRNGKKAIVVDEDERMGIRYPFTVAVIGCSMMLTYTRNGQFMGDESNEYDIVDKWEE